ncbi:preprotein translocase subunit YajC [Timonella senegalensis]|uniref:preprotein translocase subunit YajC n=1 Tax=Timonella senegalensis TaxID=1465825 RepID=UPI0028AAA726|nr:preprotein translocase subunit YajC [Timonella senegalensis]
MEMIIMIVVLFGAMFLMTRSTRKRQKEAVAFRDAMTAGTQVMTASGYVGTVVSIDGDLVTLESETGNRTKWVRAAIAKEYEAVAPGIVEQTAQVTPEAPAPSGFEIPDDVSSLISKPTETSTQPDATTPADIEIKGDDENGK